MDLFHKKEIERLLAESIPDSREEVESLVDNLYKGKIDLEAFRRSITLPFRDFIFRGGKRWRVRLFELVLFLFDGSEDLLKYSVISEIIHNGTLIADDVEDDSFIRRGRPSLHRIYGIDIAINLSQFMYFLPLRTMMSDLREDQALRLYRIFIEEMINASIGQAIDIMWHKAPPLFKNVGYQNYLAMCNLKTGSLARMAARIATALCGAGIKKEEKISRFASYLGIAFQIQDDILDLIESDLSKNKGGIGNDISEGKLTMIIIRTLKKASLRDREELLDILAEHTRNRDRINRAVTLINKYDGIAFSQRYAKRLVKEGIKEIKGSFNREKMRVVEDFVNNILNRSI